MRAILALLALVSTAVAAERMNFIVMLIDDLGVSDLACYGSKYYETPHLDQLARDAKRFTRAYSACTVCSPTRAALLTGKYPARLHITDWITGHDRPFAKLRIPDWQKQLPQSEPTIASAMKSAGYATCAIGKWHLSPEGPTAHGFDIAIADNHRGQPASYLSPYKNPNLPDGPVGEELTARCTEEAVRFIEANKAQPFFLYLPHFAVHTPLGGKPESVAKFLEKAKSASPQGPPKYAAMLAAVDDSMARLRAKLAELNLSEKTVIIFTSDNGGLLPTTTNPGLRAGKGSAYEGGVRVPLIIHWPGLTKAGSQSAEPVITMDLTATLAEAVGTEMPGDGVSLLRVLKGEPLPPRAIFWHYPHYHPGGASPYSAMRSGEWRYVEFFDGTPTGLYNLQADPEERSNLATAQPDRAAALRAELHAWREKTNAQLPTDNPRHDATRDK